MNPPEHAADGDPDGDLDRRLSAAFSDLTDRAADQTADQAADQTADQAADQAADRTARTRVGTPSRLPKPLLAAAAVIAVLAVTGWFLGPGRNADQDQAAVPGPAAPSVSGDPTPTSTPSSTRTSAVNTSPSQTAEEAQRDGVPAALARLPLSTRLHRIDPVVPDTRTTVTTKAGVWVISRPTFEPGDEYDGQPCVGIGPLGTRRVCSPEYGELLLLSTGRTRILKAYPFPASAPNWLIADTDRGVVYCGRGGDGAQWQSMVCRVDPAAQTWRVRVFPNDGQPGDHWITPQYFATMPGDWKADQTQVYNLEQPGWSAMGLGVSAAGPGTTVFDPDTLKVIRGRGTG